MYGDDCLSNPVRLQRAVGEMHVALKRFGAETVLDELRQVGCLKARFPRRVVPGWMDIVTLNTGGGVAGGDRLDVSINVGVNAQATVAAQAAERFYRARGADAPSRVRTLLTVSTGAALEWLPQETILFDRCALDRQLDVDLSADARFLGVEMLVFGRTATGERVRQGWLRDRIRVRRGGKLLLHDAIRLDGEPDAALKRPSIAGGAKIVATLLYVADDGGMKLDAVRDAVGPDEAGASAWNGMLIARMLGASSAQVRAKVLAALQVLRDARPMPRVWSC